jgi:outer membrane protein
VEKSGFAPTLAAAFEGGIIGDRFEITDRSTFYTASVLLQWELFSGLGRMHKLRKAHAAIEKIEQQRAETEQRIRLQVEKARSDFEIAQREYRTTGLQYRAADKNYLSVFKRFEQGAASSTEMTDAGELLTKADAGRSIARYELFKQQAYLFHAAAVDIDCLPTQLASKGRKK